MQNVDINQQPTVELDLWLEDDPAAELLPESASASLVATYATHATHATFATIATWGTHATWGTLSTYATSVA